MIARRWITGGEPPSVPEGRRESGSFSLLHRDPIVLFTPDWEIARPGSAMWSVLEAVVQRTAYLIIGPSWEVGETRGELLAARIGELAQRFPHLVVVVSCATPREAAVLQRRGVTAFHCAVSALLREDLFTPSHVRRRFDAIYDARWCGYKRQHLAGSVRSLGLIAPSSVPELPCTAGYSLRARVAVRHATWLSSPWGLTKPRWLSREQVNIAYGQARVGLCLSEVEGVMFASLQYLLAGLPVVTTHNRGGRDEFFSPSHVRWVDAHPRAVADAVDELVALNLDPQAIRADALAKMRAHRGRMQAWIRNAILTEGGDPGRWRGEWPDGLAHKLREPAVRAADVLAEIRGD